MKKFILVAIFLLSWASASMACSMSCCSGKPKCCCKEAPNPSVNIQNSGDVDIAGCTCQESAPQPFAEAPLVNLPGNNSSSKQIYAANQASQAATQLSVNFSLPAKYFLLKHFHSPAFVTPLRI